MSDLRVVVVDDQALMRTGFGMILNAEPDIDVVGEANNGREAVEMCLQLRPDVVLMDIRMPELDGIQATAQISDSAAIGSKVLMLTTFNLDEYVYDSVRAGASGFLLKDTPAEELVAAVRIVASGEALLSPSVTRQLIEAFVQQPEPNRDTPADLEQLTARELEVLGLIARGLSNAEIAAELILGETTVKTHVSRILMKLDIRDRVQAVVVAYESGLVRPGA